MTEITGGGTVLSFWLIGGPSQKALPELIGEMRPAIEAWARERGCKRAMGIFSLSRRGWQRVLHSLGYRPAAITLVKEL